MNETILPMLIILILNLSTFILYAVDKQKAIKNKWRISEKALLLSSLFAPWGGFIGMKVMHHKTKHKKFTILIPVFMVLHIVLLLVYLLIKQ